MNRLRSSHPALAERLETASTTTQRSIALRVAKWAVGASRLDNGLVQRSLALVEQDATHNVMRAELSTLVQDLDSHAWEVQDRFDVGAATEAEYLHAFAQARAANAVLFATDGDAAIAALESTYEALAVDGDSDNVHRIVEEGLL